MIDGPGLTSRRFFASVSDGDLRRFIDPPTLSVLDALSAGCIAGDDLRRVAATLIDLNTLLDEPGARHRVVGLVVGAKRTELEARVGQKVSSARNWATDEIARAREFFGLAEDEHTVRFPVSAITEVEPVYGLFDHQRRAVAELIRILNEDTRRAILHLPTGVGKTRTAMHLVSEWLRTNDPSVVVWLASGAELLEQAVAAFQSAWSHLGNRPVRIGSLWGNRSLSLEGFQDGLLVVGLAKAWSLMSRADSGWAARLSSRVRLVVFDEAHQSIATTYQRITEELTLDYRCALLGLTATPGRTWGDIDADGQLAAFYSHNKVGLDVPADNPIAYLIEQGYLARPHFKTLLINAGLALSAKDLTRVAHSLDIPSSIVDSLSMSYQYVGAVLAAITDLIREGHQRVLVFASSVRHAQVLTALLVARDVRSAAVTAHTGKQARNRTVHAFRARSDRPMVLVNYGVLTTGFDAPRVSAIVIARPTKSLVLYSQMVGRGIRGPRAGGTSDCEIITVVDPNLPGFGDVAAAFLNWEDVW